MKIKNISDIKEKTALLRLFFLGYLDLCNKNLVSQSIFNTKQTIIETKADGWVGDWLDWFIAKKCSQSNSDQAQSIFKNYFPELFDTLQMIKYMI